MGPHHQAWGVLQVRHDTARRRVLHPQEVLSERQLRKAELRTVLLWHPCPTEVLQILPAGRSDPRPNYSSREQRGRAAAQLPHTVQRHYHIHRCTVVGVEVEGGREASWQGWGEGGGGGVKQYGPGPNDRVGYLG